VTTDRRALAAVATQFFVNGFVYATIIPRYPEIRDRVEISTGGLGFVLTMGSIAGLLGSVLAGGVVARVGTRRSVVLAQSLTILGVGAIGLATHPVVLVGGLMAVVSGGLLATAVVAFGVSVPVHFVVVALALLVVQVLVWPNLLPVDEPHDEPGDHRAEADSRSSGGRGGAVVLALAGAAAMAMESGVGDWAAIRLTDDLTTSPEFAAAGFVAFTAGMTIGRLSGDWFQVRLGVHRLLLDASIMALTGLAVAVLVGNQWLVLPGLLVGGLGISVQFPQLYDAAARFPGRPGQGFTAMLLGQRLAAVLTPLIIGTLAQTSALGVGEAMAVVVLPAAALTIGLSLLHAAGR